MANTKVTSSVIKDDAVGADQLASNAVVTASMIDDAVTSAKIANDAIITALVADNAINNAKLSSNSVGTDQYVDNSIQAVHLQSGSVTSAKLDTNMAIGGTLTLGSHLIMGDGDIIKIGAGTDLQIFHQGGENFIRGNASASALYIDTCENLNIRHLDTDGGNSKNMIRAIGDGAVELYYSNAKKLETTSGGVAVTGALTAGSVGVTGILTLADTTSDDANKTATLVSRQYDSGTETEGFLMMQTFANSSGNRIDIGGGTSQHNASSVINFFTAGNTTTRTGTNRLSINSAGRANFGNDIGLSDNRAIRLGSGDDAAIYNDGSNTYIKNSTLNQDIIFQGNDDGSANTTALTLDMSDAGTATFNHDIKLSDNGKAIFGAGEDATIFSDGTSGYMRGFALQNKAGNKDVLTFADGGETNLFHNNNKKLATNSGGVTVTGTAILGGASFIDNATAFFGTDLDLRIFHDGSHARLRNSTGIFNIQTNDFHITDASNTSVRFYVDHNGATALYFNASNKLITTNTGIDVAGTITSSGGVTSSGAVIYDPDVGGNVTLSNDGSFGATGTGRYVTLGLGGNANGSNRIFAHNTGQDGMYFAAATGTGFNWRPNGSATDRMSLNLNGAFTLNPSAGNHSVFNESGVDVDFRVESDGNANMLFVNGGNNRVGIGTNAPVNDFSVQGSSGGLMGLHRTSGSTTGVLGSITVGNTDIDSGMGGIDFTQDGATDSARIGFFTQPTGGAKIERMRITSGGIVLFKKTSTSVNVAGGYIEGGEAIMSIADGGNTYLVRSTTSSGYTFYVTGAGVVNAVTTSINGLSDIRLKENIVDLETGLLEIMALKPRRFDWKEGEGSNKKNVSGFIAQEVETVLPDLIGDFKHDDLDDAKSVKMGDMIPTLVKAMQEQQTLIESLTARIEELEE